MEHDNDSAVTGLIEEFKRQRTRYKEQSDAQITNPICPYCLTATVGIDDIPGWTAESYGDGSLTEIHWWKAQCATCRSTVERRWVDGTLKTDVTETAHGTAVRELRETRAELTKWTSQTRWQHLRAFLGW